MNKIPERLAGLTPEEQRALLAQLLQKKMARPQVPYETLVDGQTTAELAAIQSSDSLVRAEQGPVVGPVPLTPTQHLSFETHDPDRHIFNIATLLQSQLPLAPTLLEQAVLAVLKHHDALRLRSVQETSGWRQYIAAPDDVAPFTLVDLSALPDEEQSPAVEKAAAQSQAGFNLTTGPVFRVISFDLGPHKPGRLLISVHHTSCDFLSWQIVLEDFSNAYHQLGLGEQVQLPPPTTSLKYWAARLTEHAQSKTLRRELDYWLAEPRQRVSRLPVDYPGGLCIGASARVVRVALSAQETRLLLQAITATYNSQIEAVLLTALSQTFVRWTGERLLLVDLLSHGRQHVFEDVDLSRTVGWLNYLFPVLLELAKDADPEALVKSIGKQLDRVPNRGLGYGLLRYLNGDAEIREQLRTLAQAEVFFNFRGRVETAVPIASAPVRPAKESVGPTHSRRVIRPHLFLINCHIADQELKIDWEYSENLHRRSTAGCLSQGFVEALRALIPGRRSR